MAPSPLLLLLLLSLLPFLALLPFSQAQPLSLDYYNKTCPQFLDTVRKIAVDKQLTAPTTAAGVLRLFIHDCFVEGCDASVLIASNSFNKSERDSDINTSLPGDAFDAIIRIKTAIELQCPGIVSCADILATATRDLLVMVGGPKYEVLLGRKDGLVSDFNKVEGNLARPTTPLTKIISMFQSKGFSVQEMVALAGRHTIGFTYCREFTYRLFNYSKTNDYDPSLYPKYAEALRRLCANYTKDPSMTAYNDVMSPEKFDNIYYQNMKKGLVLLQSDQEMAHDRRTKPFVDLYAANEGAFFQAFAHAMEKLSAYRVKTGKEGEVRHRCDSFNTRNK